MSDETYQRLLVMLLTLQYQFMSFMERRPELKEVMIVNDNQWTGLTHQRALGLDRLYQKMIVNDDDDDDDAELIAVTHQPALGLDHLYQLTALEQQSVVLAETFRRVMIAISRSQSCTLQQWEDVMNLLRRINNLQTEIRAAIETLEGRSTGRCWRRVFSRRSMLEHKNQVRERSPLRFQSCPNIPSILENLDFDVVRKSESLDRNITFRDSVEDMVEAIYNDLNLLEKFRKQNTKDDRSSEHHRSRRNYPGVSPSQNPQSLQRLLRALNSRERIESLSSQRFPQARNVTTATTSGERIQSLSSQRFPWARNVTTTATTSGERIQSLSSQRIHRVRNVTTVTTSGERIQSLSSQRFPWARNVTTATTSGERIQSLSSQRFPQARNATTTATTSGERIRSLSSQNFSRISHHGASAQQDNDSQSPGVRKTMHNKVPATGKKTVSAKSSGVPSVSLTNISTAVYKTVAASCAAILIFI